MRSLYPLLQFRQIQRIFINRMDELLLKEVILHMASGKEKEPPSQPPGTTPGLEDLFNPASNRINNAILGTKNRSAYRGKLVSKTGKMVGGATRGGTTSRIGGLSRQEWLSQANNNRFSLGPNPKTSNAGRPAYVKK